MPENNILPLQRKYALTQKDVHEKVMSKNKQAEEQDV